MSHYVRVSFLLEIPGEENPQINQILTDNYRPGNQIVINDKKNSSRIFSTIRSCLVRKAYARDIENFEKEKRSPGGKPSKGGG